MSNVENTGVQSPPEGESHPAPGQSQGVKDFRWPGGRDMVPDTEKGGQR